VVEPNQGVAIDALGPAYWGQLYEVVIRSGRNTSEFCIVVANADTLAS
jgi:hypothetical protein